MVRGTACAYVLPLPLLESELAELGPAADEEDCRFIDPLVGSFIAWNPSCVYLRGT